MGFSLNKVNLLVTSLVCLSVCLSRRSTASAATAGGFAAEVGRGMQLSIAAARRMGSVNFGHMRCYFNANNAQKLQKFNQSIY